MRICWSLLGFAIAFTTMGRAQAPPAPQTSAQGEAARPDQLAVGKAALQKGDFASALQFFSRYTQEDPNDNEALFDLGNAQLGLKQFDTAEKTYRAVLLRDPKAWGAHDNLVLLYAETEQWKKFDDERASIAAGHQTHAPGLPEHTAAPIDVFTVNGQRYIVREYYPLQGKFHAKYNVAWFGKDGKPAGWITCESDDIDQVEFAKKHPADAAAGKRSYSLDQYSPVTKAADGQLTQTHATLKFYDDGEPTYERVRADVMNVLEHRAGPMSSTTTHAAPASAPAPTSAAPK